MVPDELPRDLPSFLARFGTDAQCRAYLFARRWPQGFCCAGLRPWDGLPPSAAADRRVRGLRQAAFAAGRHHLRADQDRPGALVPGDLAGDLEQGRDLGHGAAAADGLRQLPDRLVLAAQDPQGHGRAGPRTARGAGRGRRDAGRRRQARQARPRCRRQDRGRRCGRGRPRQGPRPSARPAAAAGRARRLGREPGGLPRRQRRPARRGHHRRLAGLCRARPGRLRPRADQPHAGPGATRRCACPRIHLVFGLAKRWLLGTHHGAVSTKHLQAYLDEYVFRFNRRTAKSISHRFARLHRAGRPHPTRHLPRHRRPNRPA